MQYEKELNAALEAGLKAKATVMKYYHEGFHVEIKGDNSPVTEADKASDKIIRDYLGKRFPDYAFLTEESVDNKDRLKNDYVRIIDPVDGTEDFVHKDDMFTINIALAYKHKVVLGIVFIPATGDIYYGVEGSGSFKIHDGNTTKIHVNDKLTDLTVLTSVYHPAIKDVKTIEKYKDRIKHVKKIGSSIKGCYIAEGKAEITYRFEDGTKEWDTAAFQAVVENAGGLVIKFNGQPIEYNREDVYNRDGYIVLNRRENFLI